MVSSPPAGNNTGWTQTREQIIHQAQNLTWQTDEFKERRKRGKDEMKTGRNKEENLRKSYLYPFTIHRAFAIKEEKRQSYLSTLSFIYCSQLNKTMPHVFVPPHVSRQEKMVHNISHEWISMFRQAARSLSVTVPFWLWLCEFHLCTVRREPFRWAQG